MNEPAEQQPCQSCAMPLRADADRGPKSLLGRASDRDLLLPRLMNREVVL